MRFEERDIARELEAAKRVSELSGLPPAAVAESLGDRKMRDDLAKARSDLIKMAPTNMVAHCGLVHRVATGEPMIPARHHAEILRILEDREGYPFVCIIMPPSYAKSSYGSWAYPTWRIGSSGGRVRIGLISNTARQAEGFSGAIYASIHSPEFKAAYPGVEHDGNRGSARNHFYVTGAPLGPNPTLLATGIGGPVIGKRFDEIVLDDPVTWDQVRSSVTMESVRMWLRTTLVTRLEPHQRPPDGEGRMVVLTTRWGENDLVPTLEDLGFKIINFPALGYWDRKWICADCGLERKGVDRCEHCGTDREAELKYGEEPLWPEADSYEKLIKERADDEIIFELVKQGNVRVLAGDAFDSEWFQRGPCPPLAALDSLCIGIDTSPGLNPQSGDFFVATVMGSRADEEWVLHVYRDRIAAPAQERAIVDLYEDLSQAGRVPDRVAIEDTADARAVYAHLIENHRLPLNLTPARGNKVFRAIPLSNGYRARRIWHADTDWKGRPSRWLRSFEAELESFPFGENDDQVDAAVYAHHHLVSPMPRLRVLG
jgi:phage terminase large subunit-like protein